MADGNLLQPLHAGSIAVMSDVHLAAGNCVLDRPDADGIGGLTRFLDDNRIDVDVFVLLGDIFDLALSTYAETVARARKLVAVLSRHCRRIVYVPGNHDHHMWLLANEGAEIVAPFPDCPAGFAPRAERSYAQSFLRQMSAEHPFEVCYPNVYWRPPRGDGRVFVMHHGHFCESTYTLVSDIYHDGFDGKVKDLDAMEGINAGWVEMIWYHLGQAGGGVGADGLVESLFNQVAAGKTESLDRAIATLYGKKVSPLVHRKLDGWARTHWWAPRFLARWLARLIDRRAPPWCMAAVKKVIASQAEVGKTCASVVRGAVLDENLAAHCQRYLDLTAASRGDLASRDHLHLIFGHTHRFGAWPATRPFLFNDGGWLDENGSWPDAYLFHIDASANLRALRFGPAGTTLDTVHFPPPATAVAAREVA